MPCARNEAAAVEITALAAGAGPPAKRMATRRIWRGLGEEGEGEADILNSPSRTIDGQVGSAGSLRRRGSSSRDPDLDLSCRTTPGPGPGAFIQIGGSKSLPPLQHYRGARMATTFFVRIMANRVFPSGSSSSSQPWTWASSRWIVPSPPPCDHGNPALGVAHEMERRIGRPGANRRHVSGPAR